MMKKTKKRRLKKSSPFNRLPDENVLEILNKLIELKTLCVCKLVSKSFNKIVHQVDSISFTVPSDFNWDTFQCDSFWSAVISLKKFISINSLCIELRKQQGIYLFKWNVKLSTRVDSFEFISPNSIYDKKELLLVDEEDSVLTKKKIDIALNCLRDAIGRFVIVEKFVK